MPRLLIFGPGYTASRIAAAAEAREWTVERVGRRDFEADVDLGQASFVLSSVPPQDGTDPVLDRYGARLSRFGGWIGYLSSTGVYGDTHGAWVDETAPIGGGRRSARAAADRGWLALGARVFRLPGIYGPGRSPLDRVHEGTAYRVDRPGLLFSRIHVDDVVDAVLASFDAPPGAYNIADDLPAEQAEVTAYAARLLGAPEPPMVRLETLAPAARGFYSENRKAANGKAKRVLGWQPIYSSYREGLRALSATTRPAMASTLPAAAVTDQR